MRVLSNYLFFGHKQLGKWVIFFFVFYIDNLRARLGVVIYAFYPFFIRKSLVFERITPHL